MSQISMKHGEINEKVLVIALALVMALSLAACGGGEQPAPEEAAPETTAPEAPAEPEAEVMAVTFDVPEGFEPGETAPANVSQYYVNADQSNIAVTYFEQEPGFEQTTQEALEAAYMQGYQSAGFEVEQATNEFRFTEIDGAPAYIWDVAYTLNGAPIRQYILGINTDIGIGIAYTDNTPDEFHMEAFYASADTIALVRE